MEGGMATKDDLGNLDQKLGMLKIFIRLALEIKVIDNKKYLSLQEKMSEIGRMLGGWIKTLK